MACLRQPPANARSTLTRNKHLQTKNGNISGLFCRFQTSACVSTRSTNAQDPTWQEGTLRDFKADTRSFTLLFILVLRLYYTSSICASPWLVCSGPRCSISTSGGPRRKALFPIEDDDISTPLLLLDLMKKQGVKGFILFTCCNNLRLRTNTTVEHQMPDQGVSVPRRR